MSVNLFWLLLVDDSLVDNLTDGETRHQVVGQTHLEVLCIRPKNIRRYQINEIFFTCISLSLSLCKVNKSNLKESTLESSCFIETRGFMDFIGTLPWFNFPKNLAHWLYLKNNLFCSINHQFILDITSPTIFTQSTKINFKQLKKKSTT